MDKAEQRLEIPWGEGKTRRKCSARREMPSERDFSGEGIVERGGMMRDNRRRLIL